MCVRVRVRVCVHVCVCAYSCYTADFASTASLLAAGASVHVPDRRGRTALHHYADGRLRSQWSDSLLCALLEAGADLEARDADGATPLMLHMAGRHRSLITVHRMLEQGADVTAVDAHGETALSRLASGRLFPDFVYVAAMLVAAHPAPASLPADLFAEHFAALPEGSPRSLDALRAYRTDRGKKLD